MSSLLLVMAGVDAEEASCSRPLACKSARRRSLLGAPLINYYAWDRSPAEVLLTHVWREAVAASADAAGYVSSNDREFEWAVEKMANAGVGAALAYEDAEAPWQSHLRGNEPFVDARQLAGRGRAPIFLQVKTTAVSRAMLNEHFQNVRKMCRGERAHCVYAADEFRQNVGPDIFGNADALGISLVLLRFRYWRDSLDPELFMDRSRATMTSWITEFRNGCVVRAARRMPHHAAALPAAVPPAPSLAPAPAPAPSPETEPARAPASPVSAAPAESRPSSGRRWRATESGASCHGCRRRDEAPLLGCLQCGQRWHAPCLLSYAGRDWEEERERGAFLCMRCDPVLNPAAEASLPPVCSCSSHCKRAGVAPLAGGVPGKAAAAGVSVAQFIRTHFGR